MVRFVYQDNVLEIDVEQGSTAMEVKYLLFSLLDVSPDELQLYIDGVIIPDQSLVPSVAAEIIVTRKAVDWTKACTKVFLGNESCVQPYIVCRSKRVCLCCANSCLQGIPGSEKKPAIAPQSFSCECGESCLFVQRYGCSISHIGGALESAASQQIDVIRQQGAGDMERRIRSHVSAIPGFEDPDSWSIAREAMPIEDLISLADESEYSREEGLIRELLHWFKLTFKWVNVCPCDSCHSTNVERLGGDRSTAQERAFGAGMVELSKCKDCGSVTRFPRYNHPGKLMQTLRGRCGEWAQGFTLCCRALGYKARYVVDWTDHVWTEVFVNDEWIHCDPCEDAYNSPLMYETGWNKKLSYVLAFSVDEVRDVTLRYTRDLEGVSGRRTNCPEHWLSGLLDGICEDMHSNLSPEQRTELNERWLKECVEFRKMTNVDFRDLTEAEKRGRSTGSLAWRLARGELGDTAKEDDTSHKPLSKLELKVLIQKYFAQLMNGCPSKCSGPDCGSYDDKKEALKKAIRLVKEFGSSKLCQ